MEQWEESSLLCPANVPELETELLTSWSTRPSIEPFFFLSLGLSEMLVGRKKKIAFFILN